MEKPIVSVIIPTRNRSNLVLRAVKSVVVQTYSNLEIIVVIDGPDSTTFELLNTLRDTRIRIVSLSKNVGGSDARNEGIKNSEGEWIAFLDDDDEWYDQKIEQQMKLALNSRYQYPIISCKLIARTPKGEFIWPRRLPNPNEAISEYLFVRNSFTQGEGLIQTSTILAPKELFNLVKFKSGLKKHQDWDWVLRATRVSGVGIEFVKFPLSIWYIEEIRGSISSGNKWEYSLKWLQENINLVTPRAYSSFIATQVVPQIKKEKSIRNFLVIIREMISKGKPKLVDFILILSMWGIPQNSRRFLRNLFFKN